MTGLERLKSELDDFLHGPARELPPPGLVLDREALHRALEGAGLDLAGLARELGMAPGLLAEALAVAPGQLMRRRIAHALGVAAGDLWVPA